ncbi:MAG: thiamine pyrophosphate-dependent dehydrogenase E1 component subunit alpha [Pseudomonadales bacterium]
MNEKIYQLLLSMLRIRRVEEEIAGRYGEGKMRCPTHLSIGQEAVGAALGIALQKSDFVVSSHRAHAHYLGKGGDLSRMLAEIHGKEAGCSSGLGGSMHLADPDVGFMGSTAIVANSIPIGVGLGFSAQLKSSQQVSCCCFGDGAVEEGAFYESANFAVLKKLPVLFLCENNLYSVYSPMKVRQPEGRKIYQLAKAIGLHSQMVDGNDGEAVLTAIEEAAQRARAGEGPSFIEFSTYRWREHCGPNYDNDIGYRSVREFEEWKEQDPIVRLKQVLDAQAVITEDYERQLQLLDQEVNEAFEFAEKSVFPMVDSHYQHLYSSGESS